MKAIWEVLRGVCRGREKTAGFVGKEEKSTAKQKKVNERDSSKKGKGMDS